MSSRLPEPPAQIVSPAFHTAPAGTVLFRVHGAYSPTSFKKGGQGNPGRFDPIAPGGVDVPTLYLGESIACSLAETVFRIRDNGRYPAALRLGKLAGSFLTALEIRSNLKLIELCGVGLRRYNLKPQHLMMGKSSYPILRAWAEALHDLDPTAQGLVWMSRQNNTEQAIVLWEDRVSAGTLAISPSQPAAVPLLYPPVNQEVMEFAEQAGIQLY